MTSNDANLPKLSFLGPLGSHSYQCARNAFGDSVEYIERQTITDVFNAVSEEIPFALIPQENSFFGTVTETYDLLRLPEVGQQKFVRGETTHAVRHSLLVRRGVKLENVQRVMSHEQALGQCARFLSANLPGAARVKMPSTSAAAQALLSDDPEDRALESAAISSSLCASVFEGLEILHEGIQDSDTNTTRFYLLANSLNIKLPSGFRVPPPRHALVRVSLNSSEDIEEEENAPSRNRLLHLVTSTLLTTFSIPASRIDRRPSLTDTPFDDVYMIELEDPTSIPAEEYIDRGNIAHSALHGRIRAGLERVEAAGGEATVLGVW
ncbi:hypothetical protein IEO21_00057 [Rhodonia placenta]|uniref:Prephenate dehydratase domain-containing protein n=1 Tax=Rhodonia placenta TaxID=104341 RepID=A0A8H7PC57_9APHY|nr:hypothetical protein IEO21_00057 [Postia placenta]